METQNWYRTPTLTPSSHLQEGMNHDGLSTANPENELETTRQSCSMRNAPKRVHF